MKLQNTYSLSEEILNSVTHGLELIMGLAVCIFFLVKESASTIYHSILSDFCRGSRENYQQPVGHIAKIL